jgi:hypothetical protein
MLILIAIVMFLLIVASTWWFGLWSNLITLINLFLASLLASSIYQPIANELANINDTYRPLYDFIAVWLVFVLSFMILRGVTDILSAYRLKFDPVTEMIGRSVLSVWIAGVFVCFSFFTMQMAPFPPSVYGDAKKSQEELGTLPDKLWLAFIQSRSRGALSASKEKGLWPEYQLPSHPDDAGEDKRVFDPYAEFLDNMRFQRRLTSERKNLRVNN